MTAVEEIRRAAALMRERAKVATPGSWSVEDDDDGTLMGVWSATDGNYVANPYDDGPPGREDCEHIASWHPVVALAVGDWLDAAADGADEMLDILREAREIPELNWSTRPLAQMLAVARAYLGEQP